MATAGVVGPRKNAFTHALYGEGGLSYSGDIGLEQWDSESLGAGGDIERSGGAVT